MSDQTVSQSQLSSMTSIGRWLHDGPELHERLVSGAAPPLQARGSASANNNLPQGSASTKQHDLLRSGSIALPGSGSSPPVSGNGLGWTVEESRLEEPISPPRLAQHDSPRGLIAVDLPPIKRKQLPRQENPVLRDEHEPAVGSAHGRASLHRDSIDAGKFGISGGVPIGKSREKHQGGLFSRFTTWIPWNRRPRRSAPDAEACSAPGPPERVGSPIPLTTPQRIEKRFRGRKGTNKSDSEEERRTEVAKKQRRSDKHTVKLTARDTKKRTEKDVKVRYACPFHQHNPDKNQYVSCSGKGFATIHRLKAHLKKYHAPLDKDPSPKASVKAPKAERMTQSQWADLETPFRKLMYGKESREKWEAVHKVLFPGIVPVPHAYMETRRTPGSPGIERNAAREINSASTSQADLARFKDYVATRGSLHISRQLDNPEEPVATEMSHEEKSRFAARVPQLVTSLIEDFEDYYDGTGDDTGPHTQRSTSQAATRSVTHRQTTSPTFRSGEVTTYQSEAPQLPPIAPITPLVALDPTATQNNATSHSQVTQSDRNGFSLLNYSWTNPADQQGYIPNSLSVPILSHPTMDPRALSVSESDITFESELGFSFTQPSQLDPKTGSFTTAPPREVDRQADKLMDPSSQFVIDDPNQLDDVDFSYNFCPAEDVNAMSEDNKGATEFPPEEAARIQREQLEFQAFLDGLRADQ